MKKMIIGISIIFIGLTINVQAANVTFDPAEASFEVAPGNSGRANLKVNGSSSGSSSLFFKVGSKQEKGNIPIEWISPAYVNLISRTGEPSYSSMDLIVNIPPDALAGSYSGQLLPEDMRSSESIFSDGVNVSIEVVAPQSSCLGPPDISVVELKPFNIWAPTDRDVEIEIAGVISVAEGCEVASAGYSLASNDGTISGDISLDGNDSLNGNDSLRNAAGSFRKKVKVNVSRSGKDKSGRTYNGSVYATDIEGNESSVPFSVTVLHDKGNNSKLAK